MPRCGYSCGCLANLVSNNSDLSAAPVEPGASLKELRCTRATFLTIAPCAGLLMVFAVLAWSAAGGKSPTSDEPFHAMAGWLQLWHGEYRLISDHPPLWSTLAAALTGPNTIQVDPKQLNGFDLPMGTRAETLWTIQMLFRTPGNDGEAFIARFRAVMLAVAVMMGALLAGFVWRLARAAGARPGAAGAGAVLATGLLAFDPNFLGHSALMKNDVASAMALLGLTASTWAAGRVLTFGRVLSLGIWSGIAMTVKFNGPLLIGASAMLLLLRAVLPWPWCTGIREIASRPRVSRIRRLQAATATLAVMGIMTFATIWLCYGLRFAPSSEPGANMDMPGVVTACLINGWEAKHWDGVAANPPTQHQLDTMSRPAIVRLVGWANERHLLPQSFLAGLLSVFQAAQTRGTFLCGESSGLGTWWYFPFAMAVKTPITTLAAFAATAIYSASCLFRRKRGSAVSDSPVLRIEMWTALCLIVPIAIYLGTAMSSNLNLGIRHVLPIYPLLFASVGLLMARLWDWHKAAAIVIGLCVITGLAVESCSAYPDYLPFFNVLAGGSRGGLRLLSDSNLDWGQDLPLLAGWQRTHPDQKLYLAYFGTTDPAFYGIRYTNVLDGYGPGPPPEPMNGPGVLAISATTLQGPYCGQTFNKPTWYTLWRFKPFEVLGGSIYLFHVPQSPADLLPQGQSLID